MQKIHLKPLIGLKSDENEEANDYAGWGSLHEYCIKSRQAARLAKRQNNVQ